MVEQLEGQIIDDVRWIEVGKLISTLFATVERLEELFAGRRFTPDGHLVGSIGEVIAAHMFELELLVASQERHDATTRDGRMVQIKFTQGNRSIALSSEPDHLLALRLTPERQIEVVYNGAGARPWEKAGRMQKNGQRPISLSRLRELNQSVPESERLPLVRPVQLVA